MASFAGSAPLSIYVSNNGASSSSSPSSSSRLSTAGKPSNLFRSFIFTRKETNRRIVCACVAPPQDVKPADADEFSSPKFNGSAKPENLSSTAEPDDVSDVLIECRNVYKSFGEKHILRGVSFKGQGFNAPENSYKELNILPYFHCFWVREACIVEGQKLQGDNFNYLEVDMENTSTASMTLI